MVLRIVSDHRYHRKVCYSGGVELKGRELIGRVIFSIKLDTQQRSTEMIDALTRLLVDASVFTPQGYILRALNLWGHYARWRDERYSSPLLSFPFRLISP